MRLLIVPAAGLGSRLGAGVPKALVRVVGQPMLDHLLELYRPYAGHVVVVTHPSFSADVRAHLERRDSRVPDTPRWSLAEQSAPTGMLDAILEAAPIVAREDPVAIWITWCDQVGILAATAARLAAAETSNPPPAVALPTIWRRNPYIHFARDDDGQIVRVLHRREGDRLPDFGESDMGLFALSRDGFAHHLPRYAASLEPGRGTGERNFLPFIAWVSSRASVVTFAGTDEREAVGVNTPEELRAVEEWLRVSRVTPTT